MLCIIGLLFIILIKFITYQNKKSELYVITLKSLLHFKYRLRDCLYEKVCFLVIDMNGEQNSYIFNG